MIPTRTAGKDSFMVGAGERRLTLQMLSYWERLRGTRPMPTESDINPEELSELWDDCFLIHESNMNQSDYNFVYLGNNIRKAVCGSLENSATSTTQNLNMRRLTPNIAKVLNNKTPVIEDGELINDLNQLVKYRQCLLPLGDGDKVLAVFGGMRCKIFPNAHTIQ